MDDEFRDEYLSNALKNWAASSHPKPAARSRLLSIAAIMPRRITLRLDRIAPPVYARFNDGQEMSSSAWFIINAYHAGLNSVRLLA